MPVLRQGLSLATGCLLTAAVPAQSLLWQPEVQRTHSEWRETRPDGSTLLTERGVLDGIGIQAIWQTDTWQAGLGWQGLRGQRDYAGQTSRGTPAGTVVDVAQQVWRIGLQRSVMSGWHARLEIEPNRLQRDIHSTATATGYVEHWRWTQLMLGLRHEPQGQDPGWLADLQTGTATAAAVQVALPDHDPVNVRPRPQQAWRIRIGYRDTLPFDSSRTWQWRAGLQIQRIAMDASDTVPLYSSGVLRGSVSQPATRWQDTGLMLALQARWP